MTSKMETACRTGNFALVKYFVKKHEGYKWEGCANWAAYGGHIKILKYLKSNNLLIDSEAIAWASERGYLKTVKYLVSINTPIHEFAIPWACRNGHLDIIKYLVTRVKYINPDSISLAIKNGQLKVIKYLYSIEVVCTDSDCFIDAVSNRKFESLKYILWNSYENFKIKEKYPVYWYKFQVESTQKKIDELLNEVINETSLIISEYIGPDITSIIVSNFNCPKA